MFDEELNLDSSLLRVLRLIGSNPVMSKLAFIDSFSSEFINDGDISNKLNFLFDHSYCSEVDNSLILTSKGRDSYESIMPGEFEIEKEDSSSVSPTKPYLVSKLKMEPKTLSIFQALRKIDKKEIDLNPEFQRSFVWDLEKQSRLIESVLIRIPLPAFYLDATEQTKWVVVDGLQRLTTLYRFWSNEFGLHGLQFLKELEGVRFDSLPASFKILLEDDTSLQFYNLMPGTPVEAKYTIFSRVNTGGMQLAPQEIRHALTQGKVTKWLKSISHGYKFIKATDGAVETRRMSDRELALRGLAFMYFGVELYKKFGELDSFLIHAMEEFNKMNDEELVRVKDDFELSLDKVVKIFGKYAFRKFYIKNGRRSPINKALFEAWVKSVSDYSIHDLSLKRNEIVDAFLSSINFDVAFGKSISSGTGSYLSVEKRFNTVRDILRRAMND